MRRNYLWVEFLLLFVVLPLGFAAAVRYRWVGVGLFPALWLLAAGCFVTLMLDRTFDRRVLWRLGNRRQTRVVLARFVGAAIALAVCVLVYNPDNLLRLPRTRPGLWAIIMVLYPLLSVYPQGVVYRAFVFHRYRTLVGDGVGMVALSAVAFALCHAVFANWVAIVLTAVGGLMFAWTYRRSRSLTLAWFEHSLYGCLVFTVGLGRFLYLAPH